LLTFAITDCWRSRTGVAVLAPARRTSQHACGPAQYSSSYDKPVDWGYVWGSFPIFFQADTSNWGDTT